MSLVGDSDELSSSAKSISDPLAPQPAPAALSASSMALAGLRLLTCEGTVLGAAGGDEVEGHVGGPADVLVREGPVGARVALAHHALAHEVDPAHDEEGQDDADDRPDGAAVGRAVVRGQLGDFCQRPGRERRWTSTKTERVSCGGGQALCALEGVCPGGLIPAPAQDPLVEMLGGWGSTPEGLAPSSLPTVASCPSSAGLSSPTVPSPSPATPPKQPPPIHAPDLELPSLGSRLNLVQRTLTSPSGQHNGSRDNQLRPLQPAKPPKEREETCWFQ